MDPISWDKLAVLLVITSFAMFIAHWIPTGPTILDKIQRYVIGVSIIVSGTTLYLIWTGNALTAVVCWAFAFAGGAATVLGYRWDSWMIDLNILKAAKKAHAKAKSTTSNDSNA
jgi:hypothetical protein